MQWLDPGELRDGDLELVLRYRLPADRLRGWSPAYFFDMVREDFGDVGQIDLRIGQTLNLTHYAGQIGYRVDPEHRGHHFAARSVRLLVPFARRHGLDPLWITCNPDNLASRRTCELAGAEFVEIVDLPVGCDMYEAGERQKCRYRI